MRRLLGVLAIVALAGCDFRIELPMIKYDAERAANAIAVGTAYAYVKGGWDKKGSDSAEEFLKYRSLARKVDVSVTAYKRFDWQRIGLKSEELKRVAPEIVSFDRLFLVEVNLAGPDEMSAYLGKQYLILECDMVLGWEVAGKAREEWFKKMVAMSPREV